jgi:uncharacterized pyridoxal phosphate-containing UPF0001 family protein
MATITAKDVAALRERTGAGMMDCKKALMACEGDVEKAIDFLREKGLAAAAKKAGRIAAEGVVADYRDGDVAVLVEVNCGEEENKSGLLPSEVESFCLALSDFSSLRLRGFMTMAPKCEKKEDYLKYFQQTYAQVLDIWTKKLHNIGRPIISMGMSDSFEEAIACGSDIVRIGRRLFIK